MTKKRNFSVGLLLLLVVSAAIPFVAAAAAASPGSTTTLMGMPVSQTFTGLTASTAYDVVLYSPGTNVTCADAVVSDSDGELVVTIDDFNDYGANSYAVQLDTGIKTAVLTFNINNMDVIPYLLPIIIIAVIFSLMKAFTKGF